MKKKKLFITLIIGLTFFVSLSGCSNKSDNSKHNVIKGALDTSDNVSTTIVESESEKEITQTETTTKSEEEIIAEKELFGEYYLKSSKLLKNMTLEEKVGQMFLARYPGTLDSINEVKEENPGGYILFSKDFENKSKDEITMELSELQANSKVKLLLAVDEEGGTVTRVSRFSQFRDNIFYSPRYLYEIGGMEEILRDSTEKSELLKSIGLNMNLAPVVDIPTYSDSFMYDRSFSTNASETSDYASKIIERMNRDKIISSMKHFPGYGDNVDTHTGIAIDTREMEQFENSEFKPFESGIEAKCPSIMVNHNIINCMDSTIPASLSKSVHDILREKLNFSGLIVTDDLAMSAIKDYIPDGEAAMQAVIAGNDMIISSDFKLQKQEIINAVQSGKILEEKIDIAVRRILACKMYYGIIED